MDGTTVRIRREDLETLRKIAEATNLPRWAIINQALALYEKKLLPKYKAIGETWYEDE